MARYFFHVTDGKVSIDADGVELAGIDEVRREAIRAAGEMLASGEASGMLDGHSWNMTVADEDSKTVMTLCFKIEAYS
jgi:hypothetical protein